MKTLADGSTARDQEILNDNKERVLQQTIIIIRYDNLEVEIFFFLPGTFK